MKKKELKELLALREAQLLSAVSALRHAERLINFGTTEGIRNYPVISRDDYGIVRVKIGLLFDGPDEQEVQQ